MTAERVAAGRTTAGTRSVECVVVCKMILGDCWSNEIGELYQGDDNAMQCCAHVFDVSRGHAALVESALTTT